MGAEMASGTKVPSGGSPERQCRAGASGTFWSKVFFCLLAFSLLYIIFMFFPKDYYKINNIPLLLTRKFRASSWAQLLILGRTVCTCS